MPTQPCPKCGKHAYRVYGQVSHPKTGNSTSVTLPWVLCAELQVRGGKASFVVGPGRHGLVKLTSLQVAARRKAHAGSHTAAVGHVGGVKKGARAKAKPARKPAPKKAKGGRKGAEPASSTAPAGPAA